MPVDLNKRAHTAQLSLIKTLESAAADGVDLGTVEAQVVLVIDHSGSMEFANARRYSSGEVQELADRALALSLAGLDDDGNIQIVFFDHRVYDPITVDVGNYQGVVERWRTLQLADPGSPGTGLFKRGAVPARPAVYREMGGTDYLVAIRRVIKLVEEELRQDIPTLVLFVTDGKTSSEEAIIKELAQDAPNPRFWQFLGLGYEPAFLKKLDTMEGRVVDNVGLFTVTSTASMPDEEFFDKVTAEFLRKWLPSARSLQIVG